MTPIEKYKSFLPNAFINDENDEFFDFSEKMLFGLSGFDNSLNEALPLMALGESKGGWLDIIGSWIGLRRPNVAFRKLLDGEVIFQNIGTPTTPGFNAEHSLSTNNPGGIPSPVQGTYFPSILVPTEDLMIDSEYNDLLIAYQNLKYNGDTLPNVSAVLDAILSRPYSMTEYVPGEKVQFQVSDDEAFGRIVSVQTLFEQISGDGIIYVIST